jgi:galactofuranosylgalactofuranosylrhamnosyl-N-acetylglucosaminyl-diphospho-decaprenol beta-1,5/1,6-galactofuranosyltransferase
MQLMAHLLTYRYYSAALIVKAVEDFLRGPAILDADPQVLHASVGKLRSRYPEATVSRDVVLWDAPVSATPHSRVRTAAALGKVLWRNWMTPASPTARPRRLPLRDLVWFRMPGSDALAIETRWERELPLFRRDRAQFRTLLRAGLRAVRALYSAAPGLRAAWQQEAPLITSVAHWRAYLGLARRG